MSFYPFEQQVRTRDEDIRLRDAKPCPFCGSLSISLSRLQNYVHCHKCGADGPETQARDYEDRWRRAVDGWNGRFAREFKS
jgi:hypothetical protein